MVNVTMCVTASSWKFTGICEYWCGIWQVFLAQYKFEPMLSFSAFYVWSYVMSVGRDRKIDIYSVSTKETWVLGIICQLSFRVPSSYFFLQFIHCIVYIYFIITSWNSKKTNKKKLLTVHAMYSLLSISLENQTIEN